jgi:hypothetical protein
MTATKVSSTESWHSEVKQTGLPFPYYLIQKKEWDMCFIKSQKTLLKTCKVKKKPTSHMLQMIYVRIREGNTLPNITLMGDEFCTLDCMIHFRLEYSKMLALKDMGRK